MLQGSVAGLNITTSSGKPGSTPSLNIRGVNSINSADPLVLIDGVVGDLNRVNPNDVESISIIKDASAAAVYGARAAFGVILVTTKSGSAKDGKATVRYSGRFGWEEATTSTDYETAVTGRSTRSTASGRSRTAAPSTSTTPTATCSSCWRA